MLKRDYNFYLCPTKLYPYIRAILVRCWYWNIFFPDSYEEGLTEINSSVPIDVYSKIVEKAKQNYLADSHDETLDHWEQKQSKIDVYIPKEYTLENSPKYIHSCPAGLVDYIKNILKRCWYSFEIIESNNQDVTFKSNLREDALPYVIERAKMEYMGARRGEIFFISPKEEENRNGWLTYMLHYLNTNFYFIPTEENLAELEGEIYNENR